MFKEIAPDQVQKILDNNQEAKFFDVRKLEDYQQLHPVGAIHYSEVYSASFANEAEYDIPVIFICYHGLSSKKFAQHLLNLGFDEIYSVQGGFDLWNKLGLPTEK